VILTASQNASELVRGLLAFSRRQALQPRHVRINDSIRALRKLLSRVIEEHIEIRLDLAADAGEALVDPAQLESAVVNLAVNSRDAMPAGGRLVIGTALTELDESAAMERDLAPGRYVVIRVEDDGAGIPPEAIASVFEPFFTTKGIGQGTGLGLAMVYGFVRQSGGDVVIRSAPGEGTSVSLYLPAVEASVETGESSGGRRWSAGDGRRVLLVEDDPMVRHYTRTVLRRLGFEVLEAADGPQALALLEHPEQHLDLLLTDVLLPGGMSGRDVADAAAELRPDLPVVFASGYSRNELVGQGHLDSKVRLLDKPYRRVDLERVLAEVFDPE
jgi:CheY-like chemotaxis protein